MSTRSGLTSQHAHGDRKPKSQKTANPLQAGIVSYLAVKQASKSFDLRDIPKRYSRYGSLLLLGPTFPTHSPIWTEILRALTVVDRRDLFCRIVDAFKDPTLTHVAINAPIAATKSDLANGEDNFIRSPAGLLPVHGDFGPPFSERKAQRPSQSDLDAAYWTQTVQLSNIRQVWAPQWTMFSRGNISEKARILQENQPMNPFPGLSESELGETIESIDVVDFYVGIGYFAFCYLARGVARVWGWDINGWSVEGLRRGCLANGWGIRVVKITEDGCVADYDSLEDLVREVQGLENTPSAIRCVAFWGDNKWARGIFNEIDSLMQKWNKEKVLNIRHCNLGLLPSSENSWPGAVQVLSASKGGWLHIHENVEISSVLAKQHEITRQVESTAVGVGRTAWSAACHHMEQVKTYAPGVVHCVYDVVLRPQG